MNELRKNVIARMDREAVSIVELSKISGLNRKTLQRFLYAASNISTTTELSLVQFVEYPGSYRDTEDMVNVGQVRVPKEHYDYLKRHADEGEVSVAEVLRRVIENTVVNDYLWKSLDEHVNVTERAVRNTMSNTLIPFIRQQDKELNSIGNQVLFLEELVLQICSEKPSDPVMRERIKNIKNQMYEIADDQRYKRKKNV